MKKDIHLGRENLVNSFFTFLWIMVLVGVAFVISAMIFLHRVRWDLTENRLYTLSSQTRNLLAGLREPVVIYVFTGPQPFRAAEELTRLYHEANSRVTYEFLDMRSHPEQASRFRVRRPDTIVVTCRDRAKIAHGAGENDLSNAILRAVHDEPRIIYVLQGHGEHGTDDKQTSGLSLARQTLGTDNYRVKPLLLVQQDKIPDDCAVLLVPGSRTEPFPAETEHIKDYLDRGGSVVLMLDPLPSARFKPLLDAWGVRVADHTIIDTSGMGKQLGLGHGVAIINRSGYRRHPVTTDLNIASIFPLATSVSLDRNLPKDEKATLLAWTDKSSWGETDMAPGGVRYDAGRDVPGPLAVALAASRPAQNPKHESRLVLFGDSDFVTNAYLGVQGNQDFFMNAVNWAAGEEDLLGITPKAWINKRVDLTPTRKAILIGSVVIVIPAIPLLIALVLALRQR